MKKLKGEVVKAITGESSFSPEFLNSVIEDKEHERDQLKEAYLTAEEEIQNAETRLAQMSSQYDELLEWSAAYRNATMAAKKMIVTRLIERVDVFRGYKLKITLNISVEQFLNGLNVSADEEINIPA